MDFDQFSDPADENDFESDEGLCRCGRLLPVTPYGDYYRLCEECEDGSVDDDSWLMPFAENH